MSFVNQPGRDVRLAMYDMACDHCEGSIGNGNIAFRVSAMRGSDVSDDEPFWYCSSSCLDAMISALVDVELVRVHHDDE